MIIISIQFRSYASKTYDYLMRNPNNLKLDPNQDLSFISGVSKNKLITTPAIIVGFRKVDQLPSHVTSYLIIKEHNIVEPYKIAGVGCSTPQISVGPTSVKQLASAVQIAIIQRQIIILRGMLTSKKFNTDAIQAQLTQYTNLLNILKGGH